MADAVEVLGDDVETRVAEQVVNEGDPPPERVVDGDHGAGRAARLDDLERLLEGGARKGLEVGPHLPAGGVRIRPGLPLVGDAGALADTRHRFISGIVVSVPARRESHLVPSAARPRSPAAHSIRPPCVSGLGARISPWETGNRRISC